MPDPSDNNPAYDLLIIGGGINGAGIARDAAGRGLKVLLVEKDDLAAHTVHRPSWCMADCAIWSTMNSAWFAKA